MRIGVVGCGRVVERHHAPALARSAGWHVTDVADALPGRRDWACRTFVGAVAHEDPDGLIRNADVDAVIVATPPPAHAEAVLACLAAGKPVLVEKPLATCIQDAERIVAADGANGASALVGFNRRFRRGYQDARRWIRSEAGGAVEALRFELITDMTRWHRPGSGEEKTLDLMLDDVLPHQLDLVAWLCGRGISRVRAIGIETTPGGGIRLDYEAALEDGIALRACGGYGDAYTESLVVSATRDKLLALPDGTSRLAGPAALQRTWRVLGTKVRHAVRKVSGRPTPTQESFDRQLEAFAEVVRGRSISDIADARAGLAACRAVQAARRSLDEGCRWIDV